MKLQPVMRVLLTFMVAAMSTAIATVDDEQIRIICGVLLSGFAAVGIVPPHVPTRTSIDTESQRVNVVREDGLSLVEVLVAGLILVFLAALLFDRI